MRRFDPRHQTLRHERRCGGAFREGGEKRRAPVVVAHGGVPADAGLFERLDQRPEQAVVISVAMVEREVAVEQHVRGTRVERQHLARAALQACALMRIVLRRRGMQVGEERHQVRVERNVSGLRGGRTQHGQCGGQQS